MARERRRDVPDDSPVPAELRRFRCGDWPDATDAHKMWRRTRRAWAETHGYDCRAPYGKKPGRDWWAFLALCREGDR